MRSALRNELDIKHEQRIRKIREAAIAAIEDLDQLRAAGSIARTAFDAEVARIAQDKLHPHGCDLVVDWIGDGVMRFLIKVQNTGREYDLIKSFFHRDNGR
jgi:hypothetical protein